MCACVGACVGVHHYSPESFTSGPDLHSMVLHEIKENKLNLKYYMNQIENCIRVTKGRKTNESEAMLAMCMRHRTKWLVMK